MSDAHRQLLELEYIYAAAPVGLALVDRDLRYVRVNERLAKLHGIPVEEHIGRHVQEVVPEKAGILLPLYRAVLESGEAVSGRELALPLKDGGNALYIASYYPLRGADGEIIGVCGVIHDVTSERMAERELRESEARYRFLADSLPQFVWTLGDSGIAEYCNPYMLQYLGCSLEQMRAGEWKRTIHPGDLQGALKTRSEGFAKRQAFEIEMRIRRASDGEYLWHLFRARPFTHNRGEWMWLGTAIDIDGRKKAEQAHALLASIVGASSEAIIGLDCDGAITSWNRAAARLFGYSSREAVGRPVSFLAPGQQDQHLNGVLRQVMAGERFEQHETTRLHKDARELRVRITVTPILDEGGRVSGAYESVFDVTEQRRMERDLAAADERLRLVQRAVRAGTWEIELKTGAMYWSPELYELFGLPASLPPSMETFAKFAHPEDLESVISGLRDSQERNVPLSVQYRFQTQGEIRWVSAFGSVVGHDGAYRLVGISIDSTEMRKTEEAMRQAARMESIGRLAGGVAHDYNNLLAGILGGASLIAEMLPPDHSVLPMVDLVIRSSERAATLTKQLLAYSGKGAFILRHLELSKSVEEAFALLRGSIPANVALSVQTGWDLPLIEADESQVTEVVLNLATNSAEAIGKAAGRVEARTGVETLTRDAIAARFSENLAPGTYVFLEVKDSGEGMSPEVRKRIFEPFFTTKFMGRGLGLAALQGIVRGHRGGIEVESKPGQGSAFRVYFPAAVVRELDRAARARPDEPDGLVLVIDDEESVRNIIQASLERAGHTVITAPGGAKGVEVFNQRRRQISLVILDVSMSKLAGPELHECLLRTGVQVPVVVLSGYPESQALQKMEGAHVAGFLRKPFKMRELSSLVEEIMRKARPVEVIGSR